MLRVILRTPIATVSEDVELVEEVLAERERLRVRAARRISREEAVATFNRKEPLCPSKP